MNLISLEKVAKAYAHRTLLDDVSLGLSAGDRVGVVGRNGTGKSTVVEMLAEACGLNPQGGSAIGRLFKTRPSEPGLGTRLIVERGAVRPRWSYFLRADTMHSLYSCLEDNPGPAPGAVPRAQPRGGVPRDTAHQGEPAGLLPDGRA